MKKLFALLAIAVLFASCGGNTEKKAEAEAEAVVVETPSIALGEFDTKAGDFIDAEVKVTGIIDHVCKHGGKKLLLVNDDGDIHIESEERFDEELTGSEVEIIGIVREFRVDEAYCIQMEEDNIQSHSEGESDDEMFEHKMEEIKFYRDSMASAGIDHISFYSMDYVSHIEIK